MSDIKKVGVIGCGLMGSGITEVSARSGYTTVVREINDAALAAGMERIHKSTGKAVKRGKLTEEGQREILDRIQGTTDANDLSDCDVIIEAATENLGLKLKIMAEICKVKKDGALIATNTSSIPLSKLAVATGNPEGFLGLHFMNPVPVMPLVEIVKGVATSEDTYKRGLDFITSLGKETITAKDTPGFVINVLLVPYLCEAIRLIENGVATPEDIDKGMVGGCNMPMGPIALADFVGLDTTLAIADVLFEEFRDRKYAAPPLLRRMVELGRHGRKSGRGFYDYSK
jgi:3-hydroxybutyryl-CoA dehydrogenase